MQILSESSRLQTSAWDRKMAKVSFKVCLLLVFFLSSSSPWRCKSYDESVRFMLPHFPFYGFLGTYLSRPTFRLDQLKTCGVKVTLTPNVAPYNKLYFASFVVWECCNHSGVFTQCYPCASILSSYFYSSFHSQKRKAFSSSGWPHSLSHAR